MELRYPFAKPLLDYDEAVAALRVVSQSALDDGPEIAAFEHEFAAYLGAGVAVAVSSGWGALHLAWILTDLQPGDDVLCPALTHVATAHAIRAIGANPVFVDCDRATGNVSATAYEAAMTPRTRGIAVAHFAGLPCRILDIYDVASRYDLRVVEDCATALGGWYNSERVGSLGELSCYSFYAAKHITTAGQGGMLLCADAGDAERARSLRKFGVGPRADALPGQYRVTDLGYNYRMTELQAAIGRVQLRRLPEFLVRREENFRTLKPLIEDDGVQVREAHSLDVQAWYCMVVRLTHQRLVSMRDRIIHDLNEQGIGTSIYYPSPVPLLDVYKEHARDWKRWETSAAAGFSDASLSLSVGPHLTVSNMQHIGEVFRGIVRGVP